MNNPCHARETISRFLGGGEDRARGGRERNIETVLRALGEPHAVREPDRGQREERLEARESWLVPLPIGGDRYSEQVLDVQGVLLDFKQRRRRPPTPTTSTIAELSDAAGREEEERRSREEIGIVQLGHEFPREAGHPRQGCGPRSQSLSQRRPARYVLEFRSIESRK